MDGALFYKIQKAGVGDILRDEVGKMIMAMSKIENGVYSALNIEVIAALRALQMFFHGEVSSIVLEGDGCTEVFRYKYVKARSSG